MIAPAEKDEMGMDASPKGSIVLRFIGGLVALVGLFGLLGAMGIRMPWVGR